MKTKSLQVFLLCFLLAGAAFAQCSGEGCENGWCYGSDPGAAKEKYVLFSDGIQLKDYNSSVAPFEWLLANTPCLNKALYIKGVTLYEELLEAEEKGGKDPAKIMAYQDKIMELYDLRVKNYGEEADVLERKGKKAYFFLKDREDPEKWTKMYNLYNRIFELNKNNTSGTTITFLMLSLAQEKRKKKFTDEQVLEKYDAISEVIDYNLKNKGKAGDRWEDIQTTVDNLLGQIVKVDCEFVRTKMGETIKNKPEDIKTSKRAIKYMLSGKCTDDPLFLKAAENVFKVEPGYGLGLTIAKIYQSKQEMEKSISWREKIIPMANDNPADQAKLHYEIAQILSTQGKKSEARAKALKAVEVDNSVAGDAYTLIGDLYYTSGGTCTDSDPIKARACYLAAYDMYQKAGNSSKMAAAREQFPSKTDIFTMTRQEGESIPVGCWIGGSTVIRARPSDN